MRIAVCDDSVRELEQLLRALCDYDLTRRPECFVSGKDLLAAAVIPHFSMRSAIFRA